MRTFILIPGAGGSAWYWHRVVSDLEALSHDAVAVELPADDDRAGLNEYADAVIAAIGARRDPILVSQSMGAFIAPIVAEQIGARLMILLNPMVPAPGESAGMWWEATGQQAAARENAERIGLDPATLDDLKVAFGHDVPPEVWAESAQHQRDQSETPFGEPWPLQAWPGIRTHVLAGRDDRLFPIAFQRRIVPERLGIAPDEIDGGHLVALSRPAEVAEHLVNYTNRKYDDPGRALSDRRQPDIVAQLQRGELP